MPSSKCISMTVLHIIQLFLLLVPICSSIIVVTYLGPGISDEKDIDAADWRRKWLVIFAWLSIITVAINILIGASMLTK